MAPMQGPSDKRIVSTVRNLQQSPFLQLPGELRNMIYEYAFCEQAIAVSRAGGGNIKFMAEPQNYPTTRRCPLSISTPVLPFVEKCTPKPSTCLCASNTFRLHHIDTVTLFTSLTPPAQLAKVTRLQIGCTSTSRLRSELLASSMAMLTGVSHVTVETIHWPHHVQDSEDVSAAWRKGHRILLL